MNKTDRKRNKTSGIGKTSNNATNHTINDEDHDEMMIFHNIKTY